MTKHLIRIAVILVVLALVIIYPFLPGDYDRLAMPLSTMAQALGGLGLLLVPVGIAWLIYQWLSKGRGFGFALASLIVASLVMTLIALVGLATSGPALGLITIVLWGVVVARLIPRLRTLRNTERTGFNAAPLYMLIIPIAVLAFSLLAAAPLTASSRSHAIAMSAEMIAELEAYHEEYGRYPHSLAGVWKDYYPNVVAVEKYGYRPEGDAYNLYFDQPRFLFDVFGTQEYVVYNPLDEHIMLSHPSFILRLPPEEFATYQGWYEYHDAGVDHWKYFWFD